MVRRQHETGVLARDRALRGVDGQRAGVHFGWADTTQPSTECHVVPDHVGARTPASHLDRQANGSQYMYAVLVGGDDRDRCLPVELGNIAYAALDGSVTAHVMDDPAP